MKIGIILGSIREGRAGESVAEWVAEQAQQREAATYELVDLKTFDVPLLTSATVPGAAQKQYDDERVRRWSEKIDSFDGFVFVTPSTTTVCRARSRTPSTPWVTNGATNRSASSPTAPRAASARSSSGARSSPTSACTACVSRCPSAGSPSSVTTVSSRTSGAPGRSPRS